MLHVTFVRLPEAGVASLRAWLGSLDSRTDELAESYRRQHTRQELFYLIEGKDSPILVIVSDSSDLAEGAREFLNSGFPLDTEFKRLIQEAGTVDPSVELLYDSRSLVPVPPLRHSEDEDG